MLDERARLLLKTLVERYIADGQPVGSRTLSKTSGLELSPATIRNVMSDLEALGLIASPHTSAGRIPTARGYRLFVDTMITAQSTTQERHTHRDAMQGQTLHGDQPQKVIANAASLLSNLSQFVGVVVAPKRSSAIKHMEFLRLSERRLLLILVTPDGDVQNRILQTEVDYTPEQLQEATNYLNTHYSGLGIDQVRSHLHQEAEHLRSELATLMQAAVQAGSDSLAQEDSSLVVVGEKNLLTVSDLATDIHRLRSTFELFEQKTQLLRLLEQSNRADGVHIYIGGESQIVPIEQLSVVSSPYTVGGQIVGTLGVIGPTRMPYERMIKIVDITARMVGNALSQQGG